MIRLPRPPTVALLAHAVWLIGLAVLARGPVTRWLRRARVWTAVVVANGVVMTVFLWHLTALFLGDAGWLALVCLVLVATFSRAERPRPSQPGRPTRSGAAAIAALLVLAGWVILAGGLFNTVFTGRGRLCRATGPTGRHREQKHPVRSWTLPTAGPFGEGVLIGDSVQADRSSAEQRAVVAVPRVQDRWRLGSTEGHQPIVVGRGESGRAHRPQVYGKAAEDDDLGVMGVDQAGDAAGQGAGYGCHRIA